MSSSDQCAVGPDGNLLDASEITWQHDPDDPTPVGPAPSVPKPTTLHVFFRGGAAPTVKVAGSRHSVHVPKPSKHVLDADNAECASGLGSKRRRVSRKRVVESKPEEASEGDDASGGEANPAATDTDVEMTDDAAVEEAYLATKSMGDKDREV